MDQQVRTRLADSLEHVYERVGDRLDADPTRVSNALTGIRSARIDPGVFSRYFDLVFCVDSEDWGRAKELSDQLLELAKHPVLFEVLPYTQDALGEDFERFPRLAFATFTDSNPMAPPSDALFVSHCEKIAAAREIVRSVDSEIAAEAAAMKKQAEDLAKIEEQAFQQRQRSWGNRLKKIVASAGGAFVGGFTGGIASEAASEAISEIWPD